MIPTLDLKKIEETPHLQDLLLEVEDVLDSLDIYVFRNWMLGEVVKGPIIRRYWVSIILMYAYDQMPDPRAGLRLLKHGVLAEYRKEKVENTVDGEDKQVWLVELTVPRKLLKGMSDGSTDFYDDEIDVEDIENAKDMGVDAESGVDMSNGETTNDQP
jgi:hypothetical protein